MRSDTAYTLRAFKNIAIAEVSEVTPKFEVNVDIQAGLPYIANDKTGCRTEVIMKCVFSSSSTQRSKSVYWSVNL
ncbi:CU044_2847 family protein [Trichocoleus sp. FACHB-262]|uniref:CU044_2847 family protein n=1 Tax=Trichocoleus sp. FACHB-262 TaxID=2692869 RepID=UPI0037DD5219